MPFSRASLRARGLANTLPSAGDEGDGGIDEGDEGICGGGAAGGDVLAIAGEGGGALATGGEADSSTGGSDLSATAGC